MLNKKKSRKILATIIIDKGKSFFLQDSGFTIQSFFDKAYVNYQKNGFEKSVKEDKK